MATINTTITLEDQVSGTLDKIINKIDTVKNLFGGLDKITKPLDKSISGIDGGLGDVIKSADSAADAFRSMENPLDNTDKAVGKLPPELKKTEKSAWDVEKGFRGWQSAIITANQALEIVNKGLGFIKRSFKSVLDIATENMRVNTQLEVVLLNAVSSAEEYERVHKGILSTSKELSKMTGIGETQWKAAAGELSTYFSDLDALDVMMGTLADYAVGMTGDVNIGTKEMIDLATQLGKVTTGAFDGITRKGFEVTDVQKEILKHGTDMEKAAVISDIISESWDGLAEAMGKTPVGIFGRMREEVSNLQGAIGKGLTPIFATLAEMAIPAIENITEAFSNAGNWIMENIDMVLTGFSLLGVAALVLGAKMLIPWIMPLAVITLVGLAIFGIVKVFDKLGITAGQVLGGIMGTLFALFETVKIVFGVIKQGVMTVFNAVAAPLKKLFSFGEESAFSLKDTVLGVLEFILDGIFTFIGFIVNPFIDLANFFANVFQAPVTSIIKLFVGMADRVLSVVESIASGLSKFLNFLGMDTSWGDTISNLRSNLAGLADDVIAKYAPEEQYEELFERFSMSGADFVGQLSGAFERGNEMGSNLADNFKDGLGSITDAIGIVDSLGDFGLNLDEYSTSAAGGGKALKTEQQKPVQISVENIRHIHDITTRTLYQPKYAATGGVNITLDMGGQTINNNADIDNMIDRIFEEVVEAVVEADENDML